ncbi:AAA family ATPase [Actinopolymorpha sp. B11F2]|uniref:phosphotransferase-like protein n=1 Tax=Actinopolymorpha sp. B11F2 TaxID=3160862 RepID=UPI0032E45993
MPAGAEPVVILLSGPSSAGKTALAGALQRRLPLPAVWVEADRSFPAVPTTHPGWESSGRSPAAVVLAFHRSLAAWVEAGFHLIVDGSLPYGDLGLRDQCLAMFDAYDLRLVAVVCSVAILNEREASRPESRPAGWAATQAVDIHDGLRFAAEVDTSTRTPDACAEDVIAQLDLDVARPS